MSISEPYMKKMETNIDEQKKIIYFYYWVIKCILLPLAGHKNPFFDPIVEKKPYAIRENIHFSLVVTLDLFGHTEKLFISIFIIIFFNLGKNVSL